MEAIPVDVDIEGAADSVRVLVDQRDMAAAEAVDLGPDCGRYATRTRFLSWNAGKRAGHWSMPWPEFNETRCVQAEVAHDEPVPSAPDDLDPGRKDQTDGG
jgi:hypothetical protein